LDKDVEICRLADMSELISTFLNSYTSYAKFLWKTLTHPFDDYNYFTLLIGLSLLAWVLELILPWRKKQAIFRHDFWIDAFYMFFNFYIFNLIIFVALSNTSAKLFGQTMNLFGLPKDHLFDMTFLPQWIQFGVYYLIYDFVSYGIHNLLHRVPFLWRFHKVHHSVLEMGFAAHLRYHFIENIVYRSAVYISVAYLLNFKVENIFFMHATAILIGHLNHSNVGWDYGPLKYILNNPKMHIWHHAKELPQSHSKGMNFGISFSIWDYIFGTNYIPNSGRDIELGFPEVEKYPTNFFAQLIEPFKRKK
tara:strand:+ start:283 stop:1200 length:918 start_codon:yes stop_codon:yes gene_type:complete